MRTRYAAELILLALALASSGQCQSAPGGNSSASRYALEEGWQIQSSANVHDSGEVISTPAFKPSGWIPAKVPATVLAALVHHGVYPDPYYGRNLASIPGSDYLKSWLNENPTQEKSDAKASNPSEGENFSNLPMPADSPFKPAWWYRKEFELPPNWQGRHVWLHFDGINYRANIWLNGHRVAGADQVAGAWRLYRFEVTGLVHSGGENVLAVEVAPPAADDLGITWVDWNPAPPDKDMGLWRPVYLSSTGPVALRDPQIVTHFDLPSLEVAHLTIRASLENTTRQALDGTLKGRIGKVEFHQPVHLGTGETREITFTPAQFSQLNFHNPRLWWPVDLGPQNLYKLDLEFDTGNQLSDRKEIQFGVREVTSRINEHGDIEFAVNGRRLLIRGGGWAPDMMLRENPEKTELEIRYVRDMHLNALRLEGKIETDHFFDLCDRYGVLVMAGWCCCDQWEMWDQWKPENFTVAGASLRDELHRLQNHPCVLNWMYGSDKGPPPRVEKIYLQVFHDTQWPDPYESTSDATPSSLTGLPGFKGHKNGHWGPYDYIPPSYWLLDPEKRGGGWGFNTETSPGVTIPVLESLREFLPEDMLWPINDDWLLHADGSECRRNMLGAYRDGMNARYGPAADLQDFMRKAQVMDYESERAMFEAYGRNKYVATGVIQWMLNNAWPDIVWNLYDYYLRTGGAYYGTKKACEPLHVQYSYDDDSVVVVNSLSRSFDGLRVTADLFDLDLKRRFSKAATANISADSSTRIFVIPKLEGLTTTYFLKLALRNAQGQLESSNFYWLSTKPDQYDWKTFRGHATPIIAYSDVTGLNRLPMATLNLKTKTETHGGEETVRVTLVNPSPALAFSVHLRVLKGKNGPELIPTFWADNFLELMPGETREVTATYSHQDLGPSTPVISVEGWNVKPFEQGE
jgi:exo-1,4-beta-D-glucosaminidase